MTNDVIRILSAAIARKASDIHLSVGRPPIIRLNGSLADLPDAPALDADSCRAMVYSLLTEQSEDRERLFERFTQGRAERREGVGLGLAIARELVVQHRGELWVDSEPGKGSTFSFTLPQAP